MKKAILVIILIAMIVALFSGCGNMSMGIGTYSFRKVHVDTHNYSGCLTVEKWYENGTGIEVKTEEAGAMYLSEGTYILIEGDKECPFCADGGT